MFDCTKVSSEPQADHERCSCTIAWLQCMLASNAGLQAIYRAHLFTMSLLPSNLQVRPIVNKWARFSVGGSL